MAAIRMRQLTFGWRLPYCLPRGDLSQGRQPGFTLVELLVTVGIVSILAAIATANFQRASVRAKVARAHADMHSIATAIEAYYTDNLDYPMARAFCAGGGMMVDDYNMTPPELSSPVPYISAIPFDVFNRSHTYKYLSPGKGWANGVMTYLALWVPEAFPKDNGKDVPYFDRQYCPVKWGLWSVGPSGAEEFWQSDQHHYPVPSRNWYSPTNGTVSEGVIVRLSTGQTS